MFTKESKCGIKKSEDGLRTGVHFKVFKKINCNLFLEILFHKSVQYNDSRW